MLDAVSGWQAELAHKLSGNALLNWTLNVVQREKLYTFYFYTERERKLHIFSSHLGLIRCLTPIRDSAIVYSQAFLDKHRNTTNVILPHELKPGSCMLSKQASAFRSDYISSSHTRLIRCSALHYVLWQQTHGC